MNAKDKRIANLVEYIREQEQQRQIILDSMQPFTRKLCVSLKEMIGRLAEAGVANPDGMRRTPRQPLAGKLSSFSFEWQGSRYLIIPLENTSLPHPDSEVANYCQEGEQVGRIVLFHQPLDDDTIGTCIGEAFIFSSRK